MRNLSIDLSYVKGSGKGIEGYYWPVTNVELECVRDQIARNLLPEVESRDDMLPLSIGRNFLIRTLMRIWLCENIRERAARDGITLEIPSTHHVMKKIYNRNMVEPHEFEIIKKLRFEAEGLRGIVYAIGVGAPAEYLRNLLPSTKWKYRGWLSKKNLTENIVALNPNEIMWDTAQRKNVDPVVTRNDYWFDPVRPDLTLAVNNDTHQFILLLMGNLGIDVKGNLEQTIKKFVAVFSASITAHLERLRKKKYLPRILWTGTGGNLFSMILRQATMERGGEVYAYDHSVGRSFAKSMDMALVEYNCCDYFVTQNEERVLSAKEDLAELQKISNAKMLIYGNEYRKRKEIARGWLGGQKKKPTKVMYCSTCYPGDTMHMMPHKPDLVMVDWQYRLLYGLTEKGFFVYHKPHPESETKPPQDLYDGTGIQYLDGKFEKVYCCADVIITDKINSTIVKTALEKGHPLVYINIDGWEWRRDALDCLKERMGYVETVCDDNNRLYVDFDLLEDEINSAVEKSSSASFNKFVL